MPIYFNGLLRILRELGQGVAPEACTNYALGVGLRPAPQITCDVHRS